jgi:DNA-binding beta-propeller fold protein YncE
MAALWPGEDSAAADGDYSIIGRTPGSGAAWDYAIVDEHSGRLFLAQAGVTAVDLKTHTVVTGFVAGHVTHGLASLGDGTVAVDDSQTKVITIFDGASGRIVSTIPTAEHNPVSGHHALDALVFEPKTRLLVAINGESGLVLLIDIKESRVVGSVSVGDHPEFAAADGMGRIYINVNRSKTSEIVVIDVDSRKVIKHFPLKGCKAATGLVFDPADTLVLSVCENGLLKAIDGQAGRLVASIAVGRGADAVMFDPARRRAFVAGGDDGTLSVIAIRSNRDIALLQTLKTQPGTRLGAVDVASGRVYLPSAQFEPPKPPRPYPTVVPGTFEFLIAAPQ